MHSNSTREPCSTHVFEDPCIDLSPGLAEMAEMDAAAAPLKSLANFKKSDLPARVLQFWEAFNVSQDSSIAAVETVRTSYNVNPRCWQEEFLLVDATIDVETIGAEIRNDLLFTNKEVIQKILDACVWPIGEVYCLLFAEPRTVEVCAELEMVLPIDYLEHCLMLKFKDICTGGWNKI